MYLNHLGVKCQGHARCCSLVYICFCILQRHLTRVGESGHGYARYFILVYILWLETLDMEGKSNMRIVPLVTFGVWEAVDMGIPRHV